MPTKRILTSMLAVLVASMVSSSSISGKLSLPGFLSSKKMKLPSMSDISALLGSYVQNVEMPAKEYPFQSPGTLTINNIEGNLTIQEWKRDVVMVKALKHSTEQRFLDDMEVQENSAQRDGQTHLTFTTAYSGEKTKGAIDYTVYVPTKTSLRLRTGKGAINIQEITGKIVAHTTRGNIEVHNTTGTLLAQTEQNGNITAHNIQGDVKVVAHRGNIRVQGAKGNVIASTDRGKIETNFDQLPDSSRVELHAAAGNVVLGLPTSTNARVQGKTERGVLTSNHFIALHQHTTQLNREAWKDYKRTVDGSIGAGKAEVRLSSVSGNISILDTAQA